MSQGRGLTSAGTCVQLTDSPIMQGPPFDPIHPVHHCIQQCFDPGYPHSESRKLAGRSHRCRDYTLGLDRSVSRRGTALTSVRHAQLGNPALYAVLTRRLSVALLLSLCTLGTRQSYSSLLLLAPFLRRMMPTTGRDDGGARRGRLFAMRQRGQRGGNGARLIRLPSLGRARAKRRQSIAPSRCGRE